MKIIGITGGIGSGKSTVAKIIDRDYCPVFYTDIEAMVIQHTHPKAIAGMKSIFGDDIYVEGKIDRKKVGSIVFSDKNKLTELNHLIHPLVKDAFMEFVELNSIFNFVAIESAILVQSGFHSLTDFNILVTTNIESRIQRVMDRDKLSREQVMQRINNQMADSETAKYCKYTIMNNKIDELPNQIKEIFDKESE